jgi:hypothetical protein
VHEAKPDGFMFFLPWNQGKKMVGVVLIVRKMSLKLKWLQVNEKWLPLC